MAPTDADRMLDEGMVDEAEANQFFRPPKKKEWHEEPEGQEWLDTHLKYNTPVYGIRR